MWRNRLVYGTLLFLALVFVYLNGGEVPYTVLYVVLAAMVLSVGYALVLFLGLEFGLELNRDTAVKGESLTFRVTARNRSGLFIPYLHVRFTAMYPVLTGLAASSSTSLLPGGRSDRQYTLLCRYRGVYEIGVEKVEIEDFLGIVRFRGKVTDKFKVRVYPKIIQMENFLMRADMTSESALVAERSGEDTTTVSDIRRYTHGDPFRKIHWKLTAKHNQIMIKNFQPTSDQRNMVLLDLSPSGYADEVSAMVEDKLIEALVAVIWHGVTHRISTSIAYFSRELGSLTTLDVRDMADFNTAREFLTTIRFDQLVNFGDLIQLFSNESVNRIRIFAFSTSTDRNSIYGGILSARHLGNDITLAWSCPDLPPSLDNTDKIFRQAAAIRDMLDESGVATFLLQPGIETGMILEAGVRA